MFVIFTAVANAYFVTDTGCGLKCCLHYRFCIVSQIAETPSICVAL